jgi:hypothetical protein
MGTVAMRTGPRAWTLTAAAFVVLAGGACGHAYYDVDQVRDAYSKRFTCPGDRIEAKQRADLALAPADSLLALASAREAPPPDVSADPGRLALWNERHEGEAARRAEQADRLRGFYRRFDLYEVTGCGAPVLYACETITVDPVDRAAGPATKERACHPVESLSGGSDPPRVVAHAHD